ncbi:MAG: histone deacetylase family protein [Candidatus Pelagadaptatus aseana]|uniref:histone deacetylase family protein n=1 Tax=Candidatus Pelagadaptatus aseana TaxID=3120508 RepID=UPI0039B17CAF
MNLAVISSHKCQLHDMDDEHPESPARMNAIQDQLLTSGLDMVVRHVEATAATRQDLYQAHHPDYVDGIFVKGQKEERVWLDDDTLMQQGSLEAALYAAGAARDAVNLVLNDEFNQAFCIVRPPGHHAEYDKAMGFCIFNNVAVAAYHAIREHGLERVAIIDFDVHHGNGTEHICAGDQRIRFYSSFQHPFYPFGGDKPSADNIHLAPLQAGASGREFREATKVWFENIDRFAPQLILISAGFDSHVEDELGQLRLVEADFRWMTENLKVLADKHSRGKIISILEGGYSLSALARSAVAHLKALMD